MSASCSKLGLRNFHERIRLSDLDCSPPFLLRVLEMRAVEHGASALVGLRCLEQPEQGSVTCSSQIECQATAANPPTDWSRECRASGRNPSSAELPSADTEMHSFVESTPVTEVRANNDGDLALEVPVLPIANRRWATLQVEVETEVSRVEAVRAVRLAATRLGASNYETPHCQLWRGKGWQCVAELSVLDAERANDAKVD